MGSGNSVIPANHGTTSPPRQGIFLSPPKQNLVLFLVLIAITLALYDPVKNFQLVNYDDPSYINLRVQQGLTWQNVYWSFTTTDVSNWHPLTWISYLLDGTLFGASSAGLHYVNLLLHACNAALLFSLLNVATSHRWRSFFVAALFAVHPFNVQSVAWVAERKNMLSTLFFLLALGAWRRYALSPGIKRYLLVALYFALGLMAKPMIITLPCVLLLWDFWPLHRWHLQRPVLSVDGTPMPPQSLKVLVLEKIPLLVLSAASAFLTMAAQRGGGAIRDIYYYTGASRFENAAIAYAKYLHKTFWPIRFTVFYSPMIDASRRQLWLAVFLLILVTAMVMLRMRKQPYLAVGWLWYLGTLVPVIGIVWAGDQGMADRYAYIPLIGIFFAVVWAIADWTLKLPYRSYWLPATGLIILAALFADSRAQLPVWKDSVSLWSHAVQIDDNAVAEYAYAEALQEVGRGQEALARYALVVARHPNQILPHFKYAYSLLRNHQAEKAISEYLFVLHRWEGYPQAADYVTQAHYNLGLSYLQAGNAAAAEQEFKRTVQMAPSSYEAYLQLGLLYQQQNRCQEAISPLLLSLKLRQSDAGLLSLGTCFEQQGKLQEARAAFQQALRIFPNYEPAQAKLQEVEYLLARQKSP